jgi:hypothetical protein
VVIITDHNVLVSGLDTFFEKDKRRVLVLVGEEIHDQARDPQKNHLLVFGTGRELSIYAADPQRLIEQVHMADGLSFIAHPYEYALPMFGEDDISWEAWDAYGYDGLELWNSLSELKEVIHTRLDAFFYAFFPSYIAKGPRPEAIQKWDELLAKGYRVVAVGGSDAHQLKVKMGPFRKVIFPYEFHFSTINTHLLTPGPLSGDLHLDRRMVYDALRQGNAFIGYDLPAQTRGFRFTASGKDKVAIMGDQIPIGGGVTLQIRVPQKCECNLIKDGKILKTWSDREICSHITNQPGVYRVECFIQFLGKRRTWIISNPIYIQQ